MNALFLTIGCAVLLIVPLQRVHAQNLVPNGDFESYQICPYVVPFASMTAEWFNPVTTTSNGIVNDVTTPDFFHACSPSNSGWSTPVNHAGTMQPHSGDGYMGIVTGDLFGWPAYREYIEVELTSPLQAGQEYNVELWVSCARGEWDQFGYATRIGVLFTTNALVNQSFPLSQQPQLQTSSVLDNLTTWQLVSWVYTASGGERYLTIGNWNQQLVVASGANPAQGTGNGYYYIDDVSVTPVSNGQPTIAALDATNSCATSCTGSVSVAVSGGVLPYSIEWIANNTSAGTGSTLTNLCPGIYEVTVTDAAGLSTEGSIEVLAHPPITLSSEVVAQTTCAPANGQITVTASGGSGGFNYSTTPGNTIGSTLHLLEGGTYTTLVTDASGCTSELVSVVPSEVDLPEATITASTYDGCEDLCVLFDVQGENLVQFAWNFDDGHTSSEKSPEHCFEAGIYAVTMSAIGENGCSGHFTLEDKINVKSAPKVRFTWAVLSADELQAEVKFQNASEPGLELEWNFGDGTQSTEENPYKQFNDPLPYSACHSLTGTNASGCSASVEACFTIESELLVFIPNTFTPDGDEFNNVFVPVLNTDIQPEVYVFRLFNRWGELIFESQDANVGWDGTNGSGMMSQDGTYIWNFRVRKNSDDVVKEYTGSVQLIR